MGQKSGHIRTKGHIRTYGHYSEKLPPIIETFLLMGNITPYYFSRLPIGSIRYHKSFIKIGGLVFEKKREQLNRRICAILIRMR